MRTLHSGYCVTGYESASSYESPELAMPCGSIIREFLKYEPLARVILFSDNFFRLTTFVSNPNFEIASDAFATFRVCSECGTALFMSHMGWAWLVVAVTA